MQMKFLESRKKGEGKINLQEVYEAFRSFWEYTENMANNSGNFILFYLFIFSIAHFKFSNVIKHS